MTDNKKLDELVRLMLELVAEVPEIRERVDAYAAERADATPAMPPRGPDGGTFAPAGPDPYGMILPPGIWYHNNKGERYVAHAGQVDGHAVGVSVPIGECETAEVALDMAVATQKGLKLMAEGWRLIPPVMRRRVVWAIGRLPGADSGFPLQVRRNGHSL
jgi:hypothetical protein